MVNDQWQLVKDLYLRAVEVAPIHRSAFLNEVCGGNQLLINEIESLLNEGDRAGSFLDHPVFCFEESLVGRKVLQYEISEKLGEGGMGIVYKALDTRLERVVALKVLMPHLAVDPQRKWRFIKEAKAASALNHPNLITVHDLVSDEGIDWIVMEYIEGVRLDSLIAPHGLAIDKALDYAIQIADGLAQAHAAGIIHRDLKPSNVMVTSTGLVKVLDFGLAKLIPDSTTPNSDSNAQSTVMGTLAYMSPEQAQGKTVDARSDIFSFGALLYEMISGKKAFLGSDQLTILASLARDQPRGLSTLVAELPEGLERIVYTALRKRPEDRWQSVSDLKQALISVNETLLKERIHDDRTTEPLTGAITTIDTRRWPWWVVFVSQVRHLLHRSWSGATVSTIGLAVVVMGMWFWRDGFTPVISGTSSGTSSQNTLLTNVPSPPTRDAAVLRVSTDLVLAQMSLDSRSLPLLSDVASASFNIEPGTHNLHLSGEGFDLLVTFDTFANARPKIVHIATTGAIGALLIATFDSSLDVRSTHVDSAAALGAQPFRRVASGGLSIDTTRPGSHEVAVRYGTVTKHLRIDTNSTPRLELFVDTVTASGTLVLESNVPETAVFVNGMARGTINGSWKRTLAPGDYLLRVSKPGYLDIAEQKITVSAATTTKRKFLLQRATGSIHIESAAPGITITLNGVPVGTVDSKGQLAIDNVDVGTHELILSKAGFSPKTNTVDVSAGRITTISDADSLRLNPSYGSITIRVTPSTAELRYREDHDTDFTLATGNKLQVKPGTYTLEARAAGYETMSTKVNVNAAQEAQVALDLPAAPLAVITPPTVTNVAPATIKDLVVSLSDWTSSDGWWSVNKKSTYGWVRLKRGANVFICDIVAPTGRHSTAQWRIEFANRSDYILYELNTTSLKRTVVVGKTAIPKTKEHAMGKLPHYRIRLSIDANHVMHHTMDDALLDDYFHQGGGFDAGRFGFGRDSRILLYPGPTQ